MPACGNKQPAHIPTTATKATTRKQKGRRSFGMVCYDVAEPPYASSNDLVAPKSISPEWHRNTFLFFREVAQRTRCEHWRGRYFGAMARSSVSRMKRV